MVNEPAPSRISPDESGWPNGPLSRLNPADGKELKNEVPSWALDAMTVC